MEKESSGPAVLRGRRFPASWWDISLYAWLAATALSFHPAPALAQLYPFHCWGVEDGLPQTTVLVLHEDAHGYLWIGTEGGLARFDGLEFESFTTEEGLPDQRVYALAEKDGYLWIGTRRGLARFDGRRVEEVPLPDGEPAAVRALAVRAGRLWVGTQEKGLFAGDARSLAAVPLTSGDTGPPAQVGVLLTTREGTLWAGTDSGLWNDAGDAWTRMATTEEVGVVESLFEDRTGRLWIGTRGGAFRWTPGEPRPRFVEEVGKGLVHAVAQDRGHRMWFGFRGQGTLRLDGDRRRVTRDNGLAANTVRSLLRDSVGNLWLGTHGGGLCRLADESFVHFGRDQGLRSDQVLSFAEDAGGALWIGMLEGGVARFDGESFVALTAADGLSSDAVSSVAADRGGALWVATVGGGLNRVEPSGGGFRIETFTHDDGLAADQVFHVRADGDGRIWASTWGGGVSRFDGRRWESLGEDDGLASNLVFSTFEDREGRTWISTVGGLSVVDASGVRSYTTAEGMPDDRVRAAVEDLVGRIWLASDVGLIRFDGESFATVSRRDGLASDTVYLVHVDRRGRLWAGTEKGLDRLSFDGAGAVAEIRHFGSAEGFVGVETNQNAVLEDRRGRLWFGTRGATRYDPEEDHAEPRPPRVHLTGLKLYFNEVDWSSFQPAALDGFGLPSGLRLPHDRNHLLFEFTGIHHRNPGAVRFRYRLNGLEESFSPPTATRQASYPSLPPGSYTFEVQASAGGLWSEPAVLSFVVLSPWWQSWWFFVLSVTVLSGLVAVMVRLRTRRLSRLRRTLREEVRRRTEALEESRRELMAAKDAAELASRAKSQFLAAMSHELRTPLNGVIGLTELLMLTPLDGSQKKYGETIRLSSEALLALIDNILDFSKIESGLLELERKPFDVYRTIEETLLILGESAHKKNLDLAFEPHAGTPRWIVGDAARLRQVLLNLVGNGVKFTERGGVYVGSRLLAEAGETLTLQIEVRDTGIGIAREKQGNLFRSFSQLDASVSRRYGGAGLGLAISDGLVRQMNGRIRVESDKGEGASFFVEFEAQRCTQADVEAALDEHPRFELDDDSWDDILTMAPVGVLVVEDNPVNQMVIKSQLQSFGINPDVASTGLEALAEVSERPYDLLLMDLQMPEMDGLEATRAIRAQEKDGGHRMVIVAMTAGATEDDRKRSLEAGMDDYVAKPVTLETLGRILMVWLGGPSEADLPVSRPAKR